jgi:hypothetical protein
LHASKLLASELDTDLANAATPGMVDPTAARLRDRSASRPAIMAMARWAWAITDTYLAWSHTASIGDDDRSSEDQRRAKFGEPAPPSVIRCWIMCQLG